MMKIFYAPSTGGFYHDSINLDIPADAILITRKTYSLLALQPPPSGFAVGLDDSGYPALVPVAVDLNIVYAMKTEHINRSCESAIVEGFWSNALGERYWYNSLLEDQRNLIEVVLSGLDGAYACRDELGVNEFRPHTITQLRQVSEDFTLFKLQLLQRANVLKQQLDQGLAANDLSALQAITWDTPQ